MQAIVALLLFLFWILPSAHAEDFTAYLSHRTFKVQQDTDNGETIFTGLDKAGITYEILPGFPIELNQLVLRSILLSALGLPQLPYYPTFIKLPATNGHKARWVRAVIRPKGRDWQNKGITPTLGSQVEYFFQLCLHYVLGAERPPGLSYIRGHYVPTGPTPLFTQTRIPLKDFLQQFALPIDSRDHQQFWQNLDLYLSRLENFQDWNYLIYLNNPHQDTAQLQATEHKIRARIKGLRMQLPL